MCWRNILILTITCIYIYRHRSIAYISFIVYFTFHLKFIFESENNLRAKTYLCQMWIDVLTHAWFFSSKICSEILLFVNKYYFFLNPGNGNSLSDRFLDRRSRTSCYCPPGWKPEDRITDKYFLFIDFNCIVDLKNFNINNVDVVDVVLDWIFAMVNSVEYIELNRMST